MNGWAWVPRFIAAMALMLGVGAFPLVPATAEPTGPQPVLVDRWGIEGGGLPGVRQFLGLTALAVGTDGTAFVADGVNQVQSFAPGTTDTPPLHVWGGSGEGEGHFLDLNDLSVGPDGNVYVADRAARADDRGVQVFTPEGAFVRSLPVDQVRSLAVAPDGTVFALVPGEVRTFSAAGAPLTSWSIAGDLRGIAVDDDGDVYVTYLNTAGTDTAGVQKYDDDGTSLASIGAIGNDDGQFLSPDDLDVDSAGNVYVVDRGFPRIQVFDANGDYVTKWLDRVTATEDLVITPGDVVATARTSPTQVNAFTTAGALLGSWGGYGNGGPQFNVPRGIAVSGGGRVFVADRNNDRIQRLDADGNLDLTWGTAGSGAGEFDWPTDVDIGLGGKVYVLDSRNDRIQRFTQEGEHEVSFGSSAAGDSQLMLAVGIDTGSDGAVYVADATAKQVVVFDVDGNFVRRWSVPQTPRGVAIDSAGGVYVSQDGGTVEKYSSAGALLDQWGHDGRAAFSAPGAVEVDPVGMIWVADGTSTQVLRSDGTSVIETPIATMDFGFLADGRVFTVGVDDPDTAAIDDDEVRVYQREPVLVDVALAADRQTARVGETIDYELMLRNVSGGVVTGASIEDTAVPSCAGPIADLAVGETRTIRCAHQATAADVGPFSHVATVVADQVAAATSNDAEVRILGTGSLALTNTFVLDADAPFSVEAGFGGFDVAPNGEFFVHGEFQLPSSNRFQTRVQYYRPDATLLGGVTRNSSHVGLRDPEAMAQGPDGALYVVSDRPFSAPGSDADIEYRPAPEWGLGAIYEDTGGDGDYLGLDVDGEGNVYVAERARSYPTENGDVIVGDTQVVRYDAGGTASVFASRGTDPGFVQWPGEVATHDGFVYVADMFLDKVLVFTTAGTFVREVAVTDPHSIAVAPDGTLYVLTVGVGELRSFAPDGTPLDLTLVPTTFPGGPANDSRVRVDGAGRVYLMDMTNRTLRIYEELGAVGGQVVTTGVGTPVAGAQLAVLRTSDFSLAGAAVADENGEFSAPVPAGSYFVYTLDPTGDHAMGFQGAPTSVVVSAGQVTNLDATMASTRGAVTGTVTEEGSGTPIAGAWVLDISGSTGAPQAGTQANGAGQFTLSGLSAGNHYLAYVDPTGSHAPEFFADAPSIPTADTVAVVAGATASADEALPAQAPPPGGAVLSGTVTAEADGAPLEDVIVLALRTSDYSLALADATDGDGTYQLDVGPGSYRLAFVDSTGVHAMAWHPDLPYHGLADATPVDAPGVVDAELREAKGSVTGTVTDAETDRPVVGAWVLVVGAQGLAGGALTDAEGGYTVAGVAPGTYWATLVDPYGGRRQEYWDGQLGYETATPFVVEAGQATTDIDGALDLIGGD